MNVQLAVEEFEENFNFPKPAEQFVAYALRIGAIEFIPEGRKLKSGRISPYFFNSGLFNTGESISQLAAAYFHATLDLEFDVVYGPAYKGIPLATAISIAYAATGIKVGYAFNRKEEKDHGEGGLIVGADLSGKRVLIVDDVMTKGTSMDEAHNLVLTHGGIVSGAAIAFDRKERGVDTSLSAAMEFEERTGVPVFSASTIDDLLSVLFQVHERCNNGPCRIAHNNILRYKKEYGV